jgi:hypothetical protein
LRKESLTIRGVGSAPKMNRNILKTEDRPQGWPLATLLRKIRTELELETMRLETEGQTEQVCDNYQIIAKLLDAEGIERRPRRHLQAVGNGALVPLAR